MSTACWAVCGVVVERRLHNGRSPTSRDPFRWVGATIFSGPGWARCGVVVERRLHNGPEEVCTAPAAARCGTMCAGRLCTSCGHEANDQFQEQTAGNASHNLGGGHWSTQVGARCPRAFERCVGHRFSPFNERRSTTAPQRAPARAGFPFAPPVVQIVGRAFHDGSTARPRERRPQRAHTAWRAWVERRSRRSAHDSQNSQAAVKR